MSSSSQLSFAFLLAGLLATSCASVPASGQAAEPESKLARTTWPLLQTKMLAWQAHGMKAVISLSLRVNKESSVDIRLELKNEGKDPIYVLTIQPWRTSAKGKIAYVTLGTNEVMYGSELPALESLATGQQVEINSTLQLPMLVEDLNSIVVGFFGIFEGAAGFENDLAHLSEVAGWCQTDDWDLTDRFLAYLVYHPVEFPLVPLKEGPP